MVWRVGARTGGPPALPVIAALVMCACAQVKRERTLAPDAELARRASAGDTAATYGLVGRLPDAAATKQVKRLLRADENDVRIDVLDALATRRSAPPELVAEVVAVRHKGSGDVIFAAIRTLGRLSRGSDEALAELGAIVRDSQAGGQRVAAIGRLRERADRGRRTLGDCELLSSAKGQVVWECLRTIATWPEVNETIVARIQELLAPEHDDATRAHALVTLAHHRPEDAEETTRSWLRSDSTVLRAGAVEAVGQLEKAAIVETNEFADVGRNASTAVWLAALDVAARVGRPAARSEAVARLIEAARSRVPSASVLAWKSLRSLGQLDDLRPRASRLIEYVFWNSNETGERIEAAAVLLRGKRQVRRAAEAYLRRIAIDITRPVGERVEAVKALDGTEFGGETREALGAARFSGDRRLRLAIDDLLTLRVPITR